MRTVDLLVQDTKWLTHLCAVHPGSTVFQTSNPLWCDVILKKGELDYIIRDAKTLSMVKHCNIVKITGLIVTNEILQVAVLQPSWQWQKKECL